MAQIADTIPQTAPRHTWQEENGIFVPRIEEEKPQAVAAPVKVAPKPVQKTEVKHVKSVYGVPRFLAYPYVAPTQATDSVTVAADSLTVAADSVAVDTVVPGEELTGIVLIDPAAAYVGNQASSTQSHAPWYASGMSWVYLLLALLFCVVGIRIKSSKRYLSMLVSDLSDTRLRHNAFDETVRETSLLVILNIAWAACAGIFLWHCVRLFAPALGLTSAPVPDNPPGGIGICMGVAAAYLICINLAYWIVGNVFSDSKLTAMWLKGAGASTGLQTFLLFPLALVLLAYPAWETKILILVGSVFLIGKILFLYKGFRIFFNQISSWLLFLYYLCSLEIVPLILSFGMAVFACGKWL